MKRFMKIPLFNTFKNCNYLFLHNNNYVSSNINQKDLNFLNDLEITIYHLFDKDCNLNYTFKQGINVKITEVNYYNGNLKITKEINCLDNSHISLITIEESEDLDCNICVNVNTNILKNAYLDSKKLAILKSNIKYDEETLLSGKRANTEAMNVLVNNYCKHQEFNLVSKHISVESESKMTNFGICKGKSVLDINTNGYVVRNASKSVISQKTKGILLDFEAVISANPWLQIDDYDCLASHGAGIGSIDDEELYYLMSRGLTESESSRLIINGFVNPIFQEINNKELKEELMNLNILNDK